MSKYPPLICPICEGMYAECLHPLDDRWFLTQIILLLEEIANGISRLPKYGT
jgi:hypothetical protein